MNTNKEEDKETANATGNLKKLKIKDPEDWGDDSVKIPGFYSLSQLEAMVSGEKKAPVAPRDEWQTKLNVRRYWVPLVTEKKTPSVTENKTS